MMSLRTDPTVDCLHDPVASARLLAAAFDADRRLTVHAPGFEDHAHHVVVEFLHPVIAGAVAFPAEVVAHGARPSPGDVLLVIGDGTDDLSPELMIPTAPEAEIMIAYHLLWELVQLEVAGRPEVGGDSTDFLYPFLDGRTDDADDHLRTSAMAKADESRRLATLSVDVNAAVIADVAASIGSLGTSRATASRRVLTMGNGGSATDAARAVRLLSAVGVSTRSLAADYAVLTALANDLGAERVFARQIEAIGRPGDVLVGFSTSGTSSNLLAGFDEAKRQGLTTIGFAGYDGTGFAAHPSVDHTLSVGSQSVHRVQEAQAALLDAVVVQVEAEMERSVGS